MARTAQTVGILVFASMLCLPAIQMVTGFAPKTGLGGVENAAPTVQPLSLASWANGSWQESIEKWLGHDIGLRDWMVRIDNELRYVVTGTAKRPVVAGRDDFLYEDGYMPGRVVQHDFQHYQLLLRLLNLALLQQELDKIGVRLLVIVSPSKVHTYPEQLPWFQAKVQQAIADRPSLYQTSLDEFRNLGIRNLDFAAFFRAWKATDPPGTPPTFTRGGVHWSNHAAARAAQILVDEIERLTGKDLPNLDLVGVRQAPGPEADEADLARMANLLGESRYREPTPQPIVAHRRGDEGKPIPILFIGTSFVWGLTRTLCPQQVGDPLTVWYYFSSRFEQRGDSMGPKEPLDAEKKDLLAAMKRYPVIILEANEDVVSLIGHGFVDAALSALGKEPLKAIPQALVDQRLQKR